MQSMHKSNLIMEEVKIIPNLVVQEKMRHYALHLMKYLYAMTATGKNHFTEIDVIELSDTFKYRFIFYTKT